MTFKKMARHKSLNSCILLALGLSGLQAVAYAGMVTDCSNDSGPGTLRAVIGSATSGETVDASSCTNSTISLAGEIGLPATLTIVGPSDNSLTISGNHVGRVFNQGAGDLTLQHLNLIDGQVVAAGPVTGGCVSASGNLTLQKTTVSGCSATSTAATSIATGGGVSAQGVLRLTASTISGNFVTATVSYSTAWGAGVYTHGGIYTQDSSITGNVAIGHYASGGGVFAFSRGSIASTTIDSNKVCNDVGCGASYGAGGGLFLAYVHAAPYVFTISNSTISGNIASGGGGGCYCTATTTDIYNSTIAFNSAGRGGGGVYTRQFGTLKLHSTIIANDTAASNADLYMGTTLDPTSAHNLILQSNTSPAGTITDDPMLMPLANNGGPTQTHALAAASPALNAVDNVQSLSTDQRGVGFPREFPAGEPDIGAFELLPDRIFYDGFQ